MQKVWYGHQERMAATERNPGAICYGATLSWGDIRTARPIASDQNNHQAAKGQDGETLNGEQVWYMYCTTDPLNDQDVDDSGDPVFHRIPTMVSTDLVNWAYVGDAFPLNGGNIPAWIAPERRVLGP